MKVIVIHKNKLTNMPPVISAILNLLELGHEVVLIDNEVDDYWHHRLEAAGVRIYEIPSSGRTFLGKLKDYYIFRKSVFSILKKEMRDANNSLLWVEGANTIVSLGTQIKKYKYVLQILELHEGSKFQLRAIDKVIHDAKAVFIPEYNRACIYQVWFNLRQRPYVLPNKPYFLPTTDELTNISKKYQDILLKLKDKKILLYQGGISMTRMLDQIAQANINIGRRFQLLLVGPEQDKNTISKIQAIDNTAIHIPFLPAPDYLVFTSIAYIGYVCYKPTSLNNLYCAPNKINEFSAFSVPMLGNDIPGLKYIFQETGSGVIADTSNVKDIMNKLEYIDENYDALKKNAYNIYAYSDNVATIQSVLQRIN